MSEYNINLETAEYTLSLDGNIVSVSADLTDYYTKNQIDTMLGSYQLKSNLVTSVSAASTDSQYPSAKLFYDTCGDIEALINAL